MDVPRTAAALEYVRHLAVSMVEDEGETPAEVSRFLGVSERSVWRWLAAWRSGGDGSLSARPGRGRPPKLDDRQAAAVLSWVGRSPGEFGFATERWTAPRVASVLERELGVRMNHRYLNDWLRRHGVTPQMPQRVARERDEARVADWLAHAWPRLKKRPGGRGRRWRLPTRAASCSRRWPAGHSPRAAGRPGWCSGPATGIR